MGGRGGGGKGKGQEETRSGKIRIETSADWLFIMHAKALEALKYLCLLLNRKSIPSKSPGHARLAKHSEHAMFISFARSAKNMPKKFYRAKKKISRLCLTSTLHVLHRTLKHSDFRNVWQQLLVDLSNFAHIQSEELIKHVDLLLYSLQSI